MLSAQTLSNIRTALFAGAGLFCAGYAGTALLRPTSNLIPDWLPLGLAALVALGIFVAAFLAGPRNLAAAQDESYRADGKTAAAMGFWTALGMGTFLWLSGLNNPMQLAITLTAASAAYFLCHVILDLRGR